MCEKVTATRSLQEIAAVAVSSEKSEPEKLLAKLFKDDLNVDMHPQALRMFIRARWSKISTLAHNIHDPVKVDHPRNIPGGLGIVHQYSSNEA